VCLPSVAAAKRGYRARVYAEVATLQALLEGVPLPARKAELIAYARRQDARAPLHLLERLPDREYEAIDDVGEALAPVQPPSASRGQAPPPREESDLPPGGPDYVNRSPSPGAVRHDAPPDNPPQKTIEQQTKTQNEQKERQEKRLGR
jgi:Protein of unknown function (DUF2795)